jgi:cytochrome bd-type quinol oxidase subunit 2
MTEIEKDLRQISLFIPRFFGVLSAVVAALPLLDQALDILPPTIRYRSVATFLTTVTAFAIIGGDFLRLRKSGAISQGAKARLATGSFMLFCGALLSIAYVGFADYLHAAGRETNWYEEIIAIFWYIAIYASFARGLFQMALHAYLTRDIPIQRMGK